MFQVIIAVISIALVAIIAIALIWFGGSAFMSGSDRALYAQLMNHGSQIEGALKLYNADKGTYPTGTSTEILNTLTHASSGITYLKDVPVGDWYVDGGTIYRALIDMDQCKRVNVVAKKDISQASDYDGCPPCNGVAGGPWEGFRDWPGCRREAITP